MKKLLFVYNANSGVVNSWLDIGHKIIKPETYACDLCTLTHGSFREKRIWKDFKKSYPIPMAFYHKNDFLKEFNSKWLPPYEFPIILFSDGENMEPVILSKDFKDIATIEALIQLLKEIKW